MVYNTAGLSSSDHIAVGIEEVISGHKIASLIRCPRSNEIDTPQIGVGNSVVLYFGHYVTAVQQVCSLLPPHPFCCPDAPGVIGIGHPQPVNLGGKQLVEAVIGVGRAVGRGGLTQGVAVGAVEREII